ncbi:MULTISPECIES: hypothetical protein [Sphingobacterium]|uniref:Uncharacterized protein n=1 Tax=Sphingobacterium tenebrionis TaxID=3111775 RepID=A0ABU8I4I8_9SPHI|nr:hypothetical protein [Sphingobacterium sp. CZ-2]QBR11472.1 hypothetical protein E3D81_04500 [Sphingobacterium sp. CZ-2]
MSELNSYKLSRDWFDFVHLNPDKVTGNHTALYMWLVELNNRLQWREKFNITTRECMDGMSAKSRNTYSKCLQELIDWGFVIMLVKSHNQHQCNVISLLKNCASTDTSTDTSTVATTVAITHTIHKTKKQPKSIKLSKEEFSKSLIKEGADPQHVNDWIAALEEKTVSFTFSFLEGFKEKCINQNYPIPLAVKKCAQFQWKSFDKDWLKEESKIKEGMIDLGDGIFLSLSDIKQMPISDRETLYKKGLIDKKLANIPGL